MFHRHILPLPASSVLSLFKSDIISVLTDTTKSSVFKRSNSSKALWYIHILTFEIVHAKSKRQKDLTELKLPKCMKLKDEWQLKLPAASIRMGIHSVHMCFTCFQLIEKYGILYELFLRLLPFLKVLLSCRRITR